MDGATLDPSPDLSLDVVPLLAKTTPWDISSLPLLCTHHMLLYMYTENHMTLFANSAAGVNSVGTISYSIHLAW